MRASYQDIIFTSSATWVPPASTIDSYQPPQPPTDGIGLLNGQGEKWWGVPGIGYLVRGENRPRLLRIESSKQIVVENLFFLDSPYWTFWCKDCEELEVRYSKIKAARTDIEKHDVADLTAFNTDGFDFTGSNIWLHDVEVRYLNSLTPLIWLSP
jgi:polygalacturonase